MWKEYQSKKTTLLEDQEEAYIASRPNMCPLRAARIFKNFKDSSGIYPELPTKGHKCGGPSTIKLPLPMEGETLECQTLTDPPLIEKESLHRNIHHFKQAENTPLAGKDVIGSIGFGATTKTANRILEGIADIDAITNGLTSKRLFEIFKTLTPDLEIIVTKEKMMNRYKKWNGHTATSPSGRQLGYFHALFQSFKYNLDNTGDKATLEETRKLIIDVHFMMLQIAAVNIHVHARWKNMLTCMIEKDL